VPLPPAPSFFQFSDATFSIAALERAGFRHTATSEIPLEYEGQSLDDFLDWFEKSTVRMSALYRLQSPEVQRRIRDAIAEGAEPYMAGGYLRIPFSAIMFAARKPG